MTDPISNNTFHLNALVLTHQMDSTQHTITASNSSKSRPTEPKLERACQELESIFIGYLLKEMRASINRSGFISGGPAENIFTSMLDTQLSKEMAISGGIGLTRILMDQLGSEMEKKDSQER